MATSFMTELNMGFSVYDVEILHLHLFWPQPQTTHKNEHLWIRDLEKAKRKSFKNNIEELYGFSVGKDFSDKTQKAQTLEEKIINLLTLKYKTFSPKNAKHRVKR